MPPPNRGAQVTVIGPVYDVLQNGHVLIDIVSIGFATATPLSLSPQLSTQDTPDGKRRKFLTHAPPRLGPSAPVASAGGASASAPGQTSLGLFVPTDNPNSDASVFHLLHPSSASFNCFTQRTLPHRCRHGPFKFAATHHSQFG